MRSIPVWLAVGAIVGLMTTAPPAAATGVATVSISYQGDSCPPSPTYASAGARTTLILTATGNFTTQTWFTVPSLGIRVLLPFTQGTAVSYIDLGVLPAGSIPYRIDAPPLPDGYGWSCQGDIQATAH